MCHARWRTELTVLQKANCITIRFYPPVVNFFAELFNHGREISMKRRIQIASALPVALRPRPETVRAFRPTSRRAGKC